MMKILIILLFASLTVNFGQAYYKELADNETAFIKKAYNSLLDRQEARENRTFRVYKYIQRQNRHIPQAVAWDMSQAIIETTEQYNLDLSLFMRIFHVESRAVHITDYGVIRSVKGARGIGQVMPFWAETCPHARTASDLNYATINIKCAGFVLSHYMEKYKDKTLAVVAYNSGPRGVNAYLKGRPYKETVFYVANVLEV